MLSEHNVKLPLQMLVIMYKSYKRQKEVWVMSFQRSIYDAGGRASFINHAERPLRFEEIIKTVERTKELGMISIVCANSVKEAKAIATLEPDIILCEPTELIGTGQTSDASYVVATNQAIKAISPQTLIMQAAGISKPEDVTKVIELGADGSGCTSGITEADDPADMLKNMILAITKGGA